MRPDRHGFTASTFAFFSVFLFPLFTSFIIPADNPSIVGVWQLVELTNWSADGERSQPYGDPPDGKFIYTPDGHMSIHIMRRPAVPKFTERPDDTEIAEFARAYLGYYGTYSVDYEKGIVTHEVSGALNPNYVDTDREREFSISNDTLTIDIRPDNGARYLRRLVRVESFE
ncbi:MAG: lipocalin-like domain-containing protein [Saprospiraceae bacterium]|nr:lipocalin-like domain-containing protein [Saprospiraceae bacterium]